MDVRGQRPRVATMMEMHSSHRYHAPDPMQPDHLRTFLAAHRHRNYTRAGEEVFLSQSAVTRQIQLLERELGVRLFEQMGKKLHVTAAGEALAREAAGVLGALERAAETVRGLRAAEQGRLRVGASTTPGHYLLPETLGRFHRRFPKVELHYSVENSLRIENRIVANDLDLGVVGAHLAHADLHLEPVVEDEIVVFAGTTHALAERKRLTVRDLSGALWVLREKGSATRQLFESWLHAQGVRIERSLELGCPETVKATVAAGVGISFLSVHGLRTGSHRSRLQRLPVAGLDLRRPIYAAWHRDKHLSPVMTVFLDMLRAALAGLSAGR
jgi:DNA-binding transcriptional LysR family regulator